MSYWRVKRFRNDSFKEENVASKCYSEMVKSFVANGCNIEEQLSQKDLNKLLHIAVTKSFQSVVKVLVKNGADVYFRNDSGETALSLAKKCSNQQIYDSLVHTEVNVNVMNARDSSFYLKISIVVLVLESFYIDYFPTKYSSYQTIRENPVDMVLLLLNSNNMIKYFFSDLHDATVRGYEEIVETLMGYGLDVNERDKYGRLMLQCASYQGNEAAVRLLLSKGADVDKLDVFQRSALHTAIAAGQTAVVELLIRNGANVNICKYRRNLLYTAIDGQRTNRLELVKILVKEGVDVNAGLKTSLPLLHHAVEEDCTDVVALLLESGTCVNNQDSQGATALHRSISTLSRKGDHPVQIDQYYDLFTSSFKNNRNWSTRWHRRINELGKMTSLLLEHQADLNIVDDQGKTPLALKPIGTIAVVLLIKHTAKLQAGNTTIHKTNLSTVEESEKMRCFLSECILELNTMKNEIISKDVSIYDVLAERNVNKLAIYTNNDHVKEIMLSLENGSVKFPIYKQELEIQLEKGRERGTLFNSAARALKYYFGFQIPNLVVKKIMYCLSSRDWISLNESVESFL